MNIQLLSDKVMVKLEPQVAQKGMLIEVPESARSKDQPLIAKVVAVGLGGRNELGALIPMSVKVGDRVLVAPFGALILKHDSETYQIFHEPDLLGILK